MVQLGVAGVGQHFGRYREALRRLRRPVEIDAVYDCVFARAEPVATQEEAACETGLSSLARRHSVEAVLLLDAGWHGLAGLQTMARCRKPVFVAPWLSGSAADFERLHDTSTSQGVSLMPALWRRYLPATVRVQELIATEIGPVTDISMELPLDSSGAPTAMLESLVGWLDFCRYLFRTFPARSWLEAPGPNEPAGTPASHSLLVDYSPSSDESASGEPLPATKTSAVGSACRGRQANIRLTAPSGASLAAALRTALLPSSSRPLESPGRTATDTRIPHVRITCERGQAEIRSTSEIAWQLSDQAMTAEKLTADRSEHEIMLDLFCRRVAGGLLPIPDFYDVSHALRMIELAVGGGSQ